MRTRNGLEKCLVLANLSGSDLEKVLELGSDKVFNAGSTIFRAGDTAESLYLIREGKVALQMALRAEAGGSEKKTTVDIIQANEVLGWSAIIEPHVYTLTAVCLQNTGVLAVNGARLRALLQANHDIGYEFMNGIARVIASRLDDTRRLLISERTWFAAP